jgi:hypothetical protein
MLHGIVILFLLCAYIYYIYIKYTNVNIYVLVYMYVYTCIHICVFIYTYIYTHIHINIYAMCSFWCIHWYLSEILLRNKYYMFSWHLVFIFFFLCCMNALQSSCITVYFIFKFFECRGRKFIEKKSQASTRQEWSW